MANLLKQIGNVLGSAAGKVTSEARKSSDYIPDQAPKKSQTKLQQASNNLSNPINTGGLENMQVEGGPKGNLLDMIGDWGRQEKEQAGVIEAGQPATLSPGESLQDGEVLSVIPDTVEEGQVGRGNAQLLSDVWDTQYTPMYRAYLEDPANNPLPADFDFARDAVIQTFSDPENVSVNDLPGIMFDDAKRIGNSSMEFINRANKMLAEARNNDAVDNAEFKLVIPNVGQYTEDDINNSFSDLVEVPEGDNGPVDLWLVGYQLDDGSQYSLDDLYSNEWLDDGTTRLGSGKVISAQQFDKLVTAVETGEGIQPINISDEDANNPEYAEVSGIPLRTVVTLPDGNQITPEQLEAAEYEQTNTGFLNFNKVDPEAPIDLTALVDSDRGVFDNFEDFVPFVADLLATSAPYMIPGYNYATAASSIAPEFEGYNQHLVDPETGLYQDEQRNNAQALGGMALGPLELISERALGIAPGLKFAGKAGSRATLPGRLAQSIAEEALEEVIVTPFEELQQGGFDNYAANTDPLTGQALPTSATDRLLNLGGAAVQDATAGGLMGGLLYGPARGVERFGNRNRPQRYQPNNQSGTIPSEQLENLLINSGLSRQG